MSDDPETTTPAPLSLSNAFSGAKPAISEIALSFQVARDTAAHEKILLGKYDLNQLEIQLTDGSLDFLQISTMTDPSRSNSATSNAKKEKEKRRSERMMNDILLEDMRERLAELEADMAERFEKLRGQYGDDVIGGMAAAFLDDEELIGLETDKQKLQAMADKFLDENGNIKEKYKHREETQYVRDWNEAEHLKPEIAQYEGRNHLTATEHTKEKDAAETATLSSNKSNIKSSTNDGFQDTVDQAVDNGRSQLGEFTTTSNIKFGM